ncbi:MAG: replication initiation protein [Lachnospiraceae bacterium]|nr:replication initiation protein [Lachnospiraceae bacterium]
MEIKSKDDTGTGLAVYTKKEDVVAKISNVILRAKYKTTLLEQKVLHMSLARIHNYTIEKETGALVSTLDVTDIKECMGRKGNSLYNELEEVADNMTGRNIGFSNPEKKEFDYMALIIRAQCENGKFKIYYNPYLKDYIVDIKSNYTKFLEQITMSFKSLHSSLLYQVLKQKAFEPGEKINEISNELRTYEFEYNLAELLLDLGLVNSGAEEVKSVLNKSKKPDYEKAVAVAKEKKYEKWGEFERSALRPAIKEINEKTDIRVEYVPIKRGRGGKVTAIFFTVEVLPTIRTDLPEEEEIITITEEEKDEYIDWLSDLIDTPLKLKDLRSIAEEAGYSREKTEKAYAILKSTTQVDNVVGFMISAIRNNYSSAGGSQGSKKSANDNIMKQDYDIEAIEKDILAN